MAAERTLLQRFERAGPMTWLMASVAGWAVLVWLGALLGMGGHLRVTAVQAADPLPQPTTVQPARIGPLAQYAEAASRPLFTQDRRPRTFMATAPEGGEPSAQPQTLDFILTGVVISPQVQLAILQGTGDGKSQRVRVGKSPEGVASWQLLSLEPRKAIFQGSSGQLTLDLRTYGDAGKGDTLPMPAAAVVAGAAPGAVTNSSTPAVVAVAPDTAVPQTDQARIEAIRKRIEARRAQQRAAGQTGGSPQPPTP